jgi:hypothetical protein
MGNEFDPGIPGDGTSGFKHDERLSVFGTNDVQSLCVADIDFAAPQAVRDPLVAHSCTGKT